MLIRFVNFLVHIFAITFLSTEKSDSNIQTIILLLKFSPSSNINKRFTYMPSISTGGSSYRRCSVKIGGLKVFGNSQQNICVEFSI